jgi:hypothetical protein
MPALSTLEVCEHTIGSNTFSSEVLDLAPESAPSWLTFELLGINPGPPETASYQYSVDNTAPVGVYEIQLNPGLDYITITITDCAIHIDVCAPIEGTIGPLDPPEGYEGWQAGSSSTEVTFNQETQVISYDIKEPGTYYIALASLDEPFVWLVYVFDVTNCFEEYNPCLSGETTNPLNVCWYNRDGGRENYLFLSRKTYKKQIGQVTEFKSTGLIKKYVSIDDVYNGRDVPSGLIPSTHLDKVEEMKYTIQAYLWNDVSENWDVPISIDPSSFTLKQEGNGFYEYNFSFIYSEQLKVQNQ